MTDIYWIPRKGPGKLGVMPRPRGGDKLEDELKHIRSSGVEILVSTLTDLEIMELDLEKQNSLSKKSGLDFRRFPILDRSIPRKDRAPKFLKELNNELQNGKTIVIHCRQGIGRSGLMAASLLILEGEKPSAAMKRLTQVRGVTVPETPEQNAWIVQFAGSISKSDI